MDRVLNSFPKDISQALARTHGLALICDSQ
jgi:hypothetical protein